MVKHVVGGEVYDACGWLSIGDAIGYSERRVRQFESEEGMPVHRLGGRVYARCGEMLAWLRARPRRRAAGQSATV